MIRSALLKKIGYKVLNVICTNGIQRNINNTSIRLPVNYFRLFPNDYEESNFTFAQKHLKPGDHAIDIGAHIGLMSTFFGKMVKPGGKVFSFEPTPDSYATLNETVQINKLQDIVIPVNMPVTDKSGLVNFFVSNNDIDVANTLAPWEEKKSLNTIQIKGTSIDDFMADRKLSKMNFIKIDAEGAELQVLKGGYNTMKNLSPKIILALHPPAIKANKDSLEEIYTLVKSLNYDIHFETKLLDQKTFCEKNDLFDVHLLPATK